MQIYQIWLRWWSSPAVSEVGILWARNITQLAGMADRPPNTNLIRN
jgi:hypothetical protein